MHDELTKEKCKLCNRIVSFYGGWADDHVCTQQVEQTKGIRLLKVMLARVRRFVNYETHPVTVETRKALIAFKKHYHTYRRLDWDIDPYIASRLDAIFERDLII